MADYDNLDDVALESENQELQAERDKIREKQLAIQAELGRRADERRMAGVLEGMSADRRDAFIKGVTAVAKSAGKGEG